MGYDLHITRQEHWSEEETENISIDEWLAYVGTDKELELTNESFIKIGEKTSFQNKPGYCEWNAHPTERHPDSRPWFEYWKGRIATKNPDTPTIRKMIQIAIALNAKVQGDEGEYYTEESLPELERVEKEYSKLRQQSKKPWWKFW